MAINQKRKGNKGERLACKLLEDWTGKIFNRVPTSGGLQWKNSIAKGDIICTTEGHYFPFTIEVKNYSKIDFSELIRPNKKESDIEKFWSQAKRDAEIALKSPMLLMRYNGLPKGFWFVVLENWVWDLLKGEEAPLSMAIEGKMTIIGSDQFLKTSYKAKRKTIKKLIKYP